MDISERDDKEFYRVFDAEMHDWIVKRRSRVLPADAKLGKEKESQDRAQEGTYFPLVKHKLFGLAISGGGIRSATFALGVLQCLSRYGVFKFFDVLSTASGGGYLGSTLTSLIAPDKGNKQETAPEYGSTSDKFPFRLIGNEAKNQRHLFDRESDATRHLRAHGYWLIPHPGVFDVWTWTVAFRYITKTLSLLLFFIVPWVVVLMMLPLLVPSAFWNREDPLHFPIAVLMWSLPVMFFILFVIFSQGDGSAKPARVKASPATMQSGVKAGSTVLRPIKGLKDKIEAKNPEGQEINSRFAPLKRVLLSLAVICVLIDVFILTVAGVYALQDTMKNLVIAAGGTGAVMTAAVKFIGNFAAGDSKGNNGGMRKIAMDVVVGIVGYLALLILLVAAFIWLRGVFEGKPLFPWYWGTLGIALLWIIITQLFKPSVLNSFSLQSVYRNQLRQAYILQGDKSGHVQTRDNDVLLKDLLAVDRKGDAAVPDMPLHLIVTALNISGDTEVRKLGRRADSFTFSALYSGSRITGYAKTEEFYPKTTLGEAMAISGAAVAPNMGEKTVTSLSILLSIFNIRIGSWEINPKAEKRKPGETGKKTEANVAAGAADVAQISQAADELPPEKKKVIRRPLIWYWIKEMFGMASADDEYIYLSDGGHFDNSGIYELLKRRCKFVIAVDAGGTDFDNLATVVRLARIDLGIHIVVKAANCREDADGISRQHYIVAPIIYPPVPGDEDTQGILVWISTTMTKDENIDIEWYRDANPDFPHSSTADLFYDEKQFEAYRQLGYNSAKCFIVDAELEHYKEKDNTKEQLSRETLEETLKSLVE